MQLRRHFPEIEGIRGLLSLIVLFGHIFQTLDSGRHPFLWAWGGMEVFFAVSGFLIGRNYFIRYGGNASPHYFVNRALRIWPLYYFGWAFAVAATTLIGFRLHHGTVEPLTFVADPGALLPAVFLQNTEVYLREEPQTPFLFIHSWSVALEEQFYLLLAPLCFVLWRKRSLPFVVIAALVCCGLSALSRHFYLGSSPLILISRLDGFVLGLLLAFIEAHARLGTPLALRIFTLRAFRLALALSLILIAPYVAEYYGWSGPYAVVYATLIRPLLNPFFVFALFGFALLGLIATRAPGGLLTALLGGPLMRFFGRISYSTYVLHVPIVFALAPALLLQLGWNLHWQFVVAPLATLALAYVTYHTIEMPFLKLKIYGPRAPVPPVGDAGQSPQAPSVPFTPFPTRAG